MATMGCIDSLRREEVKAQPGGGSCRSRRFLATFFDDHNGVIDHEARPISTTANTSEQVEMKSPLADMAADRTEQRDRNREQRDKSGSH